MTLRWAPWLAKNQHWNPLICINLFIYWYSAHLHPPPSIIASCICTATGFLQTSLSCCTVPTSHLLLYMFCTKLIFMQTSDNFLPLWLSVCLSVYLSVCLYICLSVSFSICLSICQKTIFCTPIQYIIHQVHQWVQQNTKTKQHSKKS